MAKIVETDLDIKQWFGQLNDEVDVWITDPPYPFNNQNGTGRFKFEGGTDNMYTRLTWADLDQIYKDMYSKTPTGGRAYVFANRDGLYKTQRGLEKAGWTLRNLLVWDKQHFGGGYHWRNQLEYIVYATKGKPKTYIKGVGNIFNYKRPTKSSANLAIGYNPSGASCKPMEIWRDIIEHGVVDDDIIADPFSGSNPMKAALLTNQTLLNKIKLAYTNALET